MPIRSLADIDRDLAECSARQARADERGEHHLSELLGLDIDQLLDERAEAQRDPAHAGG